NDILIIENLTNLSELLSYPDFNIIALPAKFEAAGAPVRVIAQIL
ncbi:MAG: cyclase family protein, partial [Bacteroidetes bacterium]